MIETVNLTKKYGEFKALDQVNMHVPRGSIYGLVGPNGAGKTTLLKILTGVYNASSGESFIDKKKVIDIDDRKQNICFISDDLYYFPTSTIRNMAELYKNMYKNFDEERFVKISKVIDIDPKMKIASLSKGMKKQVAFWLAITTKPDVLILDEPVDGLDPIMRKQIWSILLQDVAERGMTVLVSSHNLRELEDVCDYVGILHEGKLVIERDLNEMKTDTHKLQLSFKDDVNLGDLEPLYVNKVGRVYTLILKGDRAEIEKKVEAYNPVIVDFIPLSLEEIFIYEIGGKGYEFKDIII